MVKDKRARKDLGKILPQIHGTSFEGNDPQWSLSGIGWKVSPRGC